MDDPDKNGIYPRHFDLDAFNAHREAESKARKTSVKPNLNEYTGLTEARSRAHHKTIHGFFFNNRRTHAAADPGVHIRSPADGDSIGLDDDRFTRRHLEDYVFLPGDTTESVTTKLLGYPKPDAFYDSDMRQVKDPRPGSRLRVFCGYLLAIEGSIYDAYQAKVVWSGPTRGSCILSGGTGRGDRGWSFEIPVKPGHYQVSARVNGREARIEFEVVETEKTL